MPVVLLLWALLLLVEKRNNIDLLKPLVIVLLGAAVWLKFRKKMDNKSLDNLEQNLTKDFKLKEFKSRDGAPFTPEVYQNLIELTKNLQILREHLKRPIKINSGYRSPAHNKKIGGASKSQHLFGKAADITVTGLTPLQIAVEIEKLIAAGKMRQGGLGRYPNFIHYDIRGTKARW